MKFKLYTNKNSLRKRTSRLLQGGETEVFENRLGWYEKRNDIEKDRYDDITFTITKRFEYKPWLLSQIYYDREDLDCVILEYNNIVDIMEEFVVGRTIKIPPKNRVNYSLITKSTISAKI